MKRFIQTFKNIFSIEDLRVRIFNTLGFLLIFRLGSYVVLPGINPLELSTTQKDGLLGLLDTFLGGAFSNASIFALGIMPYISASIIIQLVTVAFPYFQKMQKEGDSGRKKLNQWTRVLTILITIGQAIGYISATIPNEALLVDRSLVTLSSVFLLTAGTMFCMWLGEKITDKGIGNGISMLIMIGIISRFPFAIKNEFTRTMSSPMFFVIEIVALFFVIMAVVMLTQAVRRIPVQYAKQVVGNKVYGGQRQYIPIKLNTAGVMPIIFAQSILFLPSMIGKFFMEDSTFATAVVSAYSEPNSWQYNLTSAILIIVFTFFYTAISVNPNQIAEDMKRNNGFIPAVKPGPQTAEFIDDVVSKITLPGAIFLSLIAILPAFVSMFDVSRDFALFYGGTSLLIMVGVVLDTLQQVESYLLMKHYEGLMKSGRVRGRAGVAEDEL